jgi:DNA-binding transcriptional regulator LsrR (DeoR family)
MNADTLSALAAYVMREAVSSARILTVTSGVDGSAHAEMTAGDGSRWWIVVARYGAAYGWADDHADAVRQCAAELSARAQALTAPGASAA